MGLRETFVADAREFLNDRDEGFGWDVTVVAPDATEANLTGFTADIGTTIEPETGEMVSGRRASVALHILDLQDADLGIPVNVPDAAGMPWVVRFLDFDGVTLRSYKVIDTMPDRAIGVVVCILESFQETPPAMGSFEFLLIG